MKEEEGVSVGQSHSKDLIGRVRPAGRGQASDARYQPDQPYLPQGVAVLSATLLARLSAGGETAQRLRTDSQRAESGRYSVGSGIRSNPINFQPPAWRWK